MGTVAEHVAKADDNATFAAGLELTTQVNIEWAATAFFYAALHYVDALFEKKNVPYIMRDRHSKRTRMVGLTADTKPIFYEYEDLFQLSVDARYDCKGITAQQVKDDVIPAYEAVKKHIGGKL